VPGDAKSFLIFIETEVVLKVNGRALPQEVGGDGNLGIFLYEKDANAKSEAIALHPAIACVSSEQRSRKGGPYENDRTEYKDLHTFFLLRPATPGIIA
jgi:hypothetical protein